jgi:hypothetical protein
MAWPAFKQEFTQEHFRRYVAGLALEAGAGRAGTEAEQEKMGREFGEIAAAIRQKIHEVETWARDEFVRKGSFEHGMGRVEKMLGDRSQRSKPAWSGWKARSTVRCEML